MDLTDRMPPHPREGYPMAPKEPTAFQRLHNLCPPLARVIYPLLDAGCNQRLVAEVVTALHAAHEELTSKETPCRS